jgi:hypothetical protein
MCVNACPEVYFARFSLDIYKIPHAKSHCRLLISADQVNDRVCISLCVLSESEKVLSVVGHF